MQYILAILALGVLILVHELGHFIMAKINKVKVNEFSIGMGPKIFTYHGKETNYSISLLPVGGYVEMLGAQEEVDEEGSFSSKSPVRRISIILAGVVMNFLMGIAIFSVVSANFGYVDTSIEKVTKDGAFEKAGIQPGTIIKEINGNKVFTYLDIASSKDLSAGKELKIKYEYNGKEKQVTIKPTYSKKDKRYLIGVYFNYLKKPSVVQSVKHSFNECASLANLSVTTITNLLTGKGNFVKDIGGPVAVVKVSAQAAQAGMWNLIHLVGILSISLAVFNILPVPLLDGGWTVLLLIELITRRKVPEKIVGVLNGISMVLLMLLMFAVTVKDLIFKIG